MLIWCFGKHTSNLTHSYSEKHEQRTNSRSDSEKHEQHTIGFTQSDSEKHDTLRGGLIAGPVNQLGVAPVGIPLLVPGGLGVDDERKEPVLAGFTGFEDRIFSPVVMSLTVGQIDGLRWRVETPNFCHLNRIVVSEVLVWVPSGGSSASPIEKGREVLSSSLAARRFGWGSWRPC
jgi:hypothetical protein